MGVLHIEMIFINVIGDWLEGSGRIQIFNHARISTPGWVESFFSGSHVKRSRYAHLLTLFALYSMANEVYSESKFNSYEEWKVDLKKKSINALYWFTVMKLEILLFMFLKSLRSADFVIFWSCIKEILPWMFALDHTHYSK